MAELDEAQEIGSVILMASQDATKMLQSGEEPRNLPALILAAQYLTALSNPASSTGAV